MLTVFIIYPIGNLFIISLECYVTYCNVIDCELNANQYCNSLKQTFLVHRQQLLVSVGHRSDQERERRGRSVPRISQGHHQGERRQAWQCQQMPRRLARVLILSLYYQLMYILIPK